MKKRHIDDIWQRALKTFIQAFLAVLVPEVVTLLQSGVTLDSAIGSLLLPAFCGALASGISALWNVINNWLVDSKDSDDTK